MLYLLLSDIFVSFARTENDEMIELKVKNLQASYLYIVILQIDNQLQDTTMPVLLYHVAKDPEKPFFHLSRTKSLETSSIDFYRYFSILMQEINVSIEDTFLNTVLDFVKSIQIERLTVKPGGKDYIFPCVTDRRNSSPSICSNNNLGRIFRCHQNRSQHRHYIFKRNLLLYLCIPSWYSKLIAPNSQTRWQNGTYH